MDSRLAVQSGSPLAAGSAQRMDPSMDSMWAQRMDSAMEPLSAQQMEHSLREREREKFVECAFHDGV